MSAVGLPLHLDVRSPDPFYRQVSDQIRSLILAGRLLPGHPLPSIRQVARDVSASVITTKRAYEELEREGLIVMRPGLGCFVGELGTALRDQTRRGKVRELLARAVEAGRRTGLSDAEIRDILREMLDDEVTSDDDEPAR